MTAVDRAGADFTEYRRLILASLDRVEEGQGSLASKVDLLGERITRMEEQARTARWIGSVFVPALIAAFITALARKIGL